MAKALVLFSQVEYLDTQCADAALLDQGKVQCSGDEALHMGSQHASEEPRLK